MDSTYSNHGFDDMYSHNPDRSRAGSTVSTREDLLQTPQLAESSAHSSFETASYSSSRPASSRGLATPAYGSPHLSSYSNLSQQVLDAEWFETERRQRQGRLLTALPRIMADPKNSTVALQYDPGFNMGSRSSFTWPGKPPSFYEAGVVAHNFAVLESGNGLLGPDLSHYASEASLTPPSISRSVTASPPRGSLTPDHRDLKRQQDHARRDNKLHVRSQRASSSSSSVYSPPVTLADLTTGASSMPIYTTAPAQMGLLSEPPTTQYLPSFTTPLPDHSQSSMYNPYPPPSYMTDYYPSTTGASLPSQYGRPLTDPTLSMYPVSSLLGQSDDATGQVRVVQSRPKPQCWEHGCNGRQFSTFSNLLRHQREKSGQAAKATCHKCGAEFTRTTARNGHLLHDKCKQKRGSP
ncbi:hypothetical protein B0H66DRAFT_528179 [Apodospora peruviana]|uniref:Uncharacterized protein n=1 Tax=Apodospora peruviana TaxID=516989 RepID=A0AAE0IT81_9PEZI|nr:hypothetical protein B0H66DRAFT_528179 [Apodospora peruviana]